MPKIQIRRDTAANWKTNNPTLLQGELALETDERKMKIGDGTTDYNNLSYTNIADEWQKPADWVDIRSGALENSVYILVGHSADYSTYPTFKILVKSQNQTYYDVYVDGVKYATNAQNTSTTIDFQTLALASGWDVTTPQALHTHIIRVTPSSTNTIIRFSVQEQCGLLWLHSTLSNTIDAYQWFGTGKVPLLQAITTDQPTLKINSTYPSSMFDNCDSLVSVPTIEWEGAAGTQSCYKMIANNAAIKKLSFKNLLAHGDSVWYNPNLEEIKCENSYFTPHIHNNDKLKRFPPFQYKSTVTEVQLHNNPAIENATLDFSSFANTTRVRCQNTPGIKGLTVSSSAPFDGASPQINVSYTGLARAALVTLFNSMPTVNAGQVCNISHATGAADLTAEDLAIATNKGWTVTR